MHVLSQSEGPFRKKGKSQFSILNSFFLVKALSLQSGFIIYEAALKDED